MAAAAKAHIHEALIVGGGFGGVGIGVSLKRAGLDDFLILERGLDVGGVWRDNSYPGAACDVPSHLYSFSFAPNPAWSRTFASRDEIYAYLRRCAQQFDLASHLRCNAEVDQAAFDDAAGVWRVRLRDGAELAAYACPPDAGEHAPLEAELDGLPPLLIQAGTDEILLSDSLRLAARAHASRVSCRLEIHERRWHVFQLQAAQLQGARAAIETVAQFARERVQSGRGASAPAGHEARAGALATPHATSRDEKAALASE